MSSENKSKSTPQPQAKKSYTNNKINKKKKNIHSKEALVKLHLKKPKINHYQNQSSKCYHTLLAYLRQSPNVILPITNLYLSQPQTTSINN